MPNLTPLKAIRTRCLECAPTKPEIKNCEFTNCPLHPYRMGKGNSKIHPKKLSTIKAIHRYCLECNFTAKEVTLCPVTTCPLYNYRLGKNPNRKGIGRKGGNPNFINSQNTS